MLDKDFDKLFQERFESFETEPSADLWNKIENQIDGKKAKKSFFTLWQAAASIAIIICAGLWFYQPKKVIMLQGKPDTMVRLQKPAVNRNSPVEKPVLAEKLPQKENKKPSNASVSVAVLKHNSRVKIDHPVKKNSTEVSVLVMAEPALPEIREVDKPVTDNSTGLDLVAKNTEITEVETTEKEIPKRKMKNIGSLVNFVVSKVDHRKDKIIEFKEGEEGPEISGINLGILKLKSRNK